MNIKKFLSNIFLFELLSEDQLDRLASFSKLIKVKKHELIFKEHEQATGFFIVVNGKLKIFKITSEQKEQILHMVFPMDLIAEAAVFDNQTYPANCMALESSTLIKIYKDEFLKFILDNTQISFKMFHAYSKRLRHFVDMITLLSSHDIKSRFITFILNHAYKQDNNLCYQLLSSKKDVAQILHTTPETISRILRELKKEGLIIEENKKIIIPNYKLLLLPD